MKTIWRYLLMSMLCKKVLAVDVALYRVGVGIRNSFM